MNHQQPADPVELGRKRIEDAFFIANDKLLIEKQRALKKMRETKSSLAAVSGIHNEAVLEKLVELDIRPETLASLAVIPLIEVAWADGSVSKKEETAVLAAAIGIGIKKSGVEYGLLEHTDVQKGVKMLEEDIWSHFGQWGAVVVWIAIYAVFLLFIPFYKKSQIKPAGTYIAFVVAFALEMFGIPFSMYALGWAFGITLPEGVLWGHTLGNYIGLSGMYIGVLVSLIGLGLVIVGWNQIHKGYWSKEEGDGKLITSGIYGYIRHPQYTGFFLITLGMMLEWATLPLIVLYVLVLFMYYRLAKREEKDMVAEFGAEYEEYRRKTKMFIPGLV